MRGKGRRRPESAGDKGHGVATESALRTASWGRGDCRPVLGLCPQTHVKALTPGDLVK